MDEQMGFCHGQSLNQGVRAEVSSDPRCHVGGFLLLLGPQAPEDCQGWWATVYPFASQGKSGLSPLMGFAGGP